MNLSPIFLAVSLAAIALPAQAKNLQQAVFSGGCFWSVERAFDQVDGVVETISGFTGGTVADPSYREVSLGGTGHYEAVKLTYDADIVSYPQLASLFLRMIDPVDSGGQFCDRGETYRTAMWPADAAELQAAKAATSEAEAILGQKVVTEILPAQTFYAVEEYHQNFYNSQDVINTMSGQMTKQQRYASYSRFCGRDARTAELWGDQAFSKTHGY